MVSHPIEPVYYYEKTGRRLRLIYFLPPEYLTSKVQHQKAYADILKEYPDGLQVEVDYGRYAEFKKEYQIEDLFPSVEPAAIWNAVLVLAHINLLGKKFYISGFLNASAIEDIAGQIERHMDKRRLWYKDKNQGEAVVHRDRERGLNLQAIAAKQRQISRLMKSIQHQLSDAWPPNKKQPLYAVKMSDGIDPASLFIRLQQSGKRE